MTTAAETFYELHQTGTFVLVNVHDAGSAAIAQAAGAVALGTTSAGHAYSTGRWDGAGALSRDESIERAAEICAAVDIPVSVDAENGWGHRPDDVATAIRDLAAVGASGASIEDWSGDEDIGLYDPALALERIVAAVETARSLPHPFVVCARAEALLYDSGDPAKVPAKVMDDVLARLQSFAAAGADCLYAPGTQTSDQLAHLVDNAGGPINGLLRIGSGFSVTDATELGVRRVSLGGSLYRATMTFMHNYVERLVATGDLSLADPLLSDEDIMAMVPHPTD